MFPVGFQMSPFRPLIPCVDEDDTVPPGELALRPADGLRQPPFIICRSSVEDDQAIFRLSRGIVPGRKDAAECPVAAAVSSFKELVGDVRKVGHVEGILGEEVQEVVQCVLSDAEIVRWELNAGVKSV